MNPSKNIFLLDSQINFSEINWSNNRDSQIITFDFDSHDALNKKSVSHLISDTFLSKNELLDIQKNAYLLSDWYKEETLEENIVYENVNLGSLIQAEFINILVNYSKRFLECLNIIRKFGADENYHCSGLTYEIMKHFSVKVEKINDSSDDNLFFPLDSLKVKMKLGIKNYSTELEISQNLFKKLKKITEKSSRFLSNKGVDLSQKNILISEFNTLSYESLFSKIPEFKLNFIFFNRRQPTMWNTKTFSMIKKSGVIVENDYTLMNSEIKKNIKNDKKNIELKILVTGMHLSSEFGNTYKEIIKEYGIEAHSDRFKKELVRKLINKMVIDLIKQIETNLNKIKPKNVNDIRNAGFNIASFSNKMKRNILEIRLFLNKRMYNHKTVTNKTKKYKKIIENLYQLYVSNKLTIPTKWINETYKDIKVDKKQIIIDYISGMTDRYILKICNKI